MTASADFASSVAGWRLDSSYGRLPERLFARVQPTAVRAPQWVLFNRPLALELGLVPQCFDVPEAAALFAGNVLPEGAQPLAQAYAGHQYGHFTVLGDGRAILLGEQRTPAGARVDVQLKGPGPTPFSRRGDGRAALGPMLREYIISEAMHALGVPTTRSLAVVATGEPVFREETLPGAVLTRIAASHVRVGTFEWAAAHGDTAALAALTDFTLRRHYPEAADSPEPAAALLAAVAERQESLLARWLLLGFVHGVMNTDNMALSGETIDYGPCAFLDTYHPATVFSSIDHHGRYAYANQPRIAQWNLARLAEALLPLLHPDEAKAVELANAALEQFPGQFERHWLAGMRAKLGLAGEDPGDHALADDLLAWMQDRQADFTNTFRLLSTPDLGAGWLPDDAGFQAWRSRWLARLGVTTRPPSELVAKLRRANPAVIPRNHRVEAALAAATRGDLAPLHRLLEVLATPFNHERAPAEFTAAPPSDSPRYRTFCGT
jgi:uncharacterized protein YdiU (UPF0061 family)